MRSAGGEDQGWIEYCRSEAQALAIGDEVGLGKTYIAARLPAPGALPAVADRLPSAPAARSGCG
jgi:hypothetical protein